MLTKRVAVLSLFSAMVAKMAHADDPNWKATPDNAMTLRLWSGPSVWTVNLDQMARIDAILNGQTVSISPAEVFEALKGQ